MSEEHRKQLTETDPTCAGLYAVGAGFALPPVVTEYDVQVGVLVDFAIHSGADTRCFSGQSVSGL